MEVKGLMEILKEAKEDMKVYFYLGHTEEYVGKKLVSESDGMIAIDKCEISNIIQLPNDEKFILLS